ncbi:hypothetical protein [Streptomyces sp. NPDC002758]
MFDAIGERYQDSNGTTYIVVEPRDNGRGLALLLEDFDILAHPDTFEWGMAETTHDYLDQPVRIDDNPEMTRIVQQRMAEDRVRQEVLSKVPDSESREFYNAMDDVEKCSTRMMAAQDEIARYSAIRARALQKMVDIVGSQPPVAKLLGMNQSTLSRALRPRD